MKLLLFWICMHVVTVAATYVKITKIEENLLKLARNGVFTNTIQSDTWVVFEGKRCSSRMNWELRPLFGECRANEYVDSLTQACFNNGYAKVPAPPVGIFQKAWTFFISLFRIFSEPCGEGERSREKLSEAINETIQILLKEKRWEGKLKTLFDENGDNWPAWLRLPGTYLGYAECAYGYIGIQLCNQNDMKKGMLVQKENATVKHRGRILSDIPPYMLLTDEGIVVSLANCTSEMKENEKRFRCDRFSTQCQLPDIEHCSHTNNPLR